MWQSEKKISDNQLTVTVQIMNNMILVLSSTGEEDGECRAISFLPLLFFLFFFINATLKQNI